MPTNPSPPDPLSRARARGSLGDTWVHWMTEIRPSLELRQRVVDACHVLFNEGQEHFHLGHVSAREPGSSVICAKPSGIGLGEVTVDDLATMTLDGEKLDGPRPLHQEMPIHTEIYRRRTDVTCVVHTHPFYAAALSATRAELTMGEPGQHPVCGRRAAL